MKKQSIVDVLGTVNESNSFTNLSPKFAHPPFDKTLMNLSHIMNTIELFVPAKNVSFSRDNSAFVNNEYRVAQFNKAEIRENQKIFDWFHNLTKDSGKDYEKVTVFTAYFLAESDLKQEVYYLDITFE